MTRVDVDHDNNLDHRELRTLDYLTRQQLLRQLDTDHDRKLSLLELEQVLAPKESAPSNYPYPEEPLPVSPPPPEKFRNLRRFGIGIQQTPPTPRSQPFAPRRDIRHLTKLQSFGDESFDRWPLGWEMSSQRQHSSDFLSPRE